MVCVRIMDTTYLHIGMILSTLGLSPHGFALGLYPKGLIPMEIFVHPYIPMILPISSQCGTLVVYPTILPSLLDTNCWGIRLPHTRTGGVLIVAQRRVKHTDTIFYVVRQNRLHPRESPYY